MSGEFKAAVRSELAHDYTVFYVTAWGYAADHLFGWFAKALNSHPDLFALLAHEGSRPKYFTERTRADRPALVPFTEFLNDMGMTYAAIGDCYSYRAGQMPALLAIPRYNDIPVVNLLRHPVTWLEFYVRWRSGNMRMREGATDPLAWEWKSSCHGYFDYLGLRPYEKDDIEIWASYQGMFQLNNVLGDLRAIDNHRPIEAIADDPQRFAEVVRFLTGDRVAFDTGTLDTAFATRDTLYRGEAPMTTEPSELLGAWPGWKVDAFRRLVGENTRRAYASFGYDLGVLAGPAPKALAVPGRVSRSVFVSSLPKSGTWLLREVIARMTGLEPHEPLIGQGQPHYDDEMLIEFPPGRFFSWHSVVTPKTASLLRGAQTRNVFLIRNLFDLLSSMFNHLCHDIDAAAGRSVGGAGYFENKTLDQCMTLMIAGFTSPELTWMGVAPILRQMDSMLDLVESGEALLIDYDRLVNDKRRTLRRLAAHLGVTVSGSQIADIERATDKDTMRERLRAAGTEAHVANEGQVVGRGAFLPYHMEMLDVLVMQHAPNLPKRLASLGFDGIV